MQQNDIRARDGWMRRCILLTPSLQYDEWVRRISEATSRAGLELLVWHDHDIGPVEGEDRRVILSTNKKFLLPAPGTHPVAIVSDVATAMQQTNILTGAKARDAIIDASKLVVDALTWENVDVFTDRRIQGCGGRLSILSDLLIDAPPVLSARTFDPLEAASAEFLRMFAEGIPDVGATCNLSPELFLYDPRRREQRSIIQRLDTTGGPRSFVHGPDITLPGGLWEITAKFSVDEDAARHRQTVEWGLSDDFEAFEIVPGKAGIYQVTLAHAWMQAGGVELRFRLMEGSMGGEFEFLGAHLRFLGLWEDELADRQGSIERS